MEQSIVNATDVNMLKRKVDKCMTGGLYIHKSLDSQKANGFVVHLPSGAIFLHLVNLQANDTRARMDAPQHDPDHDHDGESGRYVYRYHCYNMISRRTHNYEQRVDYSKFS